MHGVASEPREGMKSLSDFGPNRGKKLTNKGVKAHWEGNGNPRNSWGPSVRDQSGPFTMGAVSVTDNTISEVIVSLRPSEKERGDYEKKTGSREGNPWV